MDKNSLIGLLLIGAIIVAFSIYNRPSQEQLAAQKRKQDSIQLVEAERARLEVAQRTTDSLTSVPEEQGSVDSFFSASKSAISSSDSMSVSKPDSVYSLPEKEQLIVLENNKIKLKLSTKGGVIHSVMLKDFLRYNKDSLYFWEGDEANFNLELYNRNSVKLSTENLYFTPIISSDQNSVIMRLESSPAQYIDFVYTLPEDEYMMRFEIRVVGMSDGLHPESLRNFKLNWQQKLRQQEKGESFERRYARIMYKYQNQGVEKMNPNKSDSKELTEPVQWFAFKDQYFTTVVIPDKSFNTTILHSDDIITGNYLKNYRAEAMVPVSVDEADDAYYAGFRYYFGPVHYYTLKAYDKGIDNDSDKLLLHEQVDLGYRWLSWVNKWFVLPIFNLLRNQGLTMGLIILILTLLVKLIILPLTYKSFTSTAKMRVLRPQIQEIEKKYPGQDQEMMMKRQKETMELYSKAGVSPMSGCLPMLLQMPILLALFFFFPSAIELRQQGFLWADDLSTYDSIIQWSGNIPLVTRFMGNHISLFCLLMTIVNVWYSTYNMKMADTGQAQMAGMKYMPIFMAVFMFFILNSYPAGLNYYYLLSTLITMIVTFVFQKTLDEDKLLAQLEENKKKPKKKSGFMARLEEAQKMQEKQARERAKENAKKNYRR
ncbi:MAG: membrane protein insertase YidC [Dysgonomonadaceae bacterium]|nr:membrane protein insertase YidC [Dysgonamonadaceae bacterium]